MSDPASAALTVDPSADPSITPTFDADAISRAQAAAVDNGVTLAPATVLAILSAALTPPPAPPVIPVSQGMIAAGRVWWVAHPADPVHVLLPALYRAMDQQRQDEAAQDGGAVADVGAQPAAAVGS